MYINSMPYVVSEGSNVFLFADNTKIFREINSIDDCNMLQQDVINLQKWSDDGLLKLHPEKMQSVRSGEN